VSNTLTSTGPMIVRRPTALAVLAVAQFIIALDYSIIYVRCPALPATCPLPRPWPSG